MSALVNATKKAREWTTRRDALIRGASAAGQSNRSIANETGLSHTAIANILKREDGRNAVGMARGLVVPSPPRPQNPGSGHSPQPTEAEIEAGARALYEVRKQPGQVKWEHLMQGSSRANYRHQARSVLIAALTVSGEMPRQARAPQHP